MKRPSLIFAALMLSLGLGGGAAIYRLSVSETRLESDLPPRPAAERDSKSAVIQKPAEASEVRRASLFPIGLAALDGTSPPHQPWSASARTTRPQPQVQPTALPEAWFPRTADAKSLPPASEFQPVPVDGPSRESTGDRFTQTPRSVPVSLPSLPAVARSVAAPARATSMQPPPAVDAVVEMDFSAPGNSFQFGTKMVSVEGYTEDENGTALDLVVETTPDVPAVAAAESVDPRKRLGGFTYEEELFRLKWGWAAFDRARRIATGMNAGGAATSEIQ